MGIFSKNPVVTEPVVTEVEEIQPEVVAEVVESPVEDLGSVEESNKAYGEELAGDGPTDGAFVAEPFRKEGETQQEYNERVPVAVQPVLERPTHSYLGDVL